MSNPDTELGHYVDQAIAETVEGMAFIVVSPDARNAADENEEWLWACVEVKDPLQGRFTMAFSRAIAEDIMSSIFTDLEGEDGADKDRLADVLKEMVNTMAGRCLNRLVPADISFALTMPEFGSGWPELGKADVFRFITDDGKPLVAGVSVSILSNN